jgi:competence protein ComEC
MTLLSVGAGQCAIVETPDNKIILIDAGSSTITDLHRRVIEPYLRAKGRRAVDAVFISHANLDHFSAVSDIIDSSSPGAMHLTPQFTAHARANYPAAALLRAINDRKIPIHPTTANQSIRLDSQTSLDILWPTPIGVAMSPNNTSQVLRLTCHGRTILFTGDIQEPALQRLAHQPNLTADILIAPHHGSAEPATKFFLQVVRPTWILSSNDRTLSRKQLDFEPLAKPATLLRTHTSGAITVRIRKNGSIDVTPFLK